MPRRGNVPKSEVLPDPIYNSKFWLQSLINSVMLDGKKGVAQKVVYGAFDIVAGEDRQRAAWKHSTEAMENVMPCSGG